MTLTEKVGYYNGKIGPLDEMSVPMNDRVVFFGDGVYDATMAEGGVIFGLDDHIDRFFNSCRLLEIPIAMTKDEVRAELGKCLDACSAKAGRTFVYWQATRGTCDRNHVFPAAGIEPNLLITVTPQQKKNPYEKLKLITVEDIRYELCNIKTLNLIPNVLASQRAAEKGCDEAVLHRGEIVTECAHSNVHIIKNGVFRTHPADNHILPGIARKHIIEIAKEKGIRVEEREFTLKELFDADEVIVSSSSALFKQAAEIDGIPVGGKAQDILDVLRREYFERFKSATKCNYWED